MRNLNQCEVIGRCIKIRFVISKSMQNTIVTNILDGIARLFLFIIVKLFSVFLSFFRIKFRIFGVFSLFSPLDFLFSPKVFRAHLHPNMVSVITITFVRERIGNVVVGSIFFFFSLFLWFCVLLLAFNRREIGSAIERRRRERDREEEMCVLCIHA